jgi:nickel transport protein
MDSVLDRRRPNELLIATMWRLMFAALASIAFLGGAEAHKLKAFATAEGPLVSGYAYFTPGGRAQQADVTITGPGGVEVLKTGVNGQGEFHFVAKQRIDYTITVDGGDSHVATFTIHAADLPDSLPAPEGGKILPLDPPTAATVAAAGAATVAAAGAATPEAVEPAPAAGSPTAAGSANAIDPAALRALIRESVAREVNPLREQLDAFQESVGWRDVVSGLGYIFGLCGVAYFFGTWRSNRRSAPASQARTREAAQKRA